MSKPQLGRVLPSILISSSRTILITCCDGESAVSTSCPIAFAWMRVDQLFDDLEIDVGLEQRQTNLFQRFGNVLFGEDGLSAQALERAL